MVQHFYSRKELKLKKKIVSGKLTNVLDAQGLVSRMKASFWNVTENVVLHESEHKPAHVTATLPVQDSCISVWLWSFVNRMNNWIQSDAELE